MKNSPCQRDRKIIELPISFPFEFQGINTMPQPFYFFRYLKRIHKFQLSILLTLLSFASFAQLPSVGLVKDINTLAITSSGSPNGMIKLGSVLIFSANGGTGSELWKTDGTQAGTVQVKEINTSTATASSGPSSFVVMGSFVYFTATDGVNGRELWRTDGTTAGTTLVKDINTTAATGGSIAQLVSIGSKLYFRANDGVNGTEPWVSDGTTAGTFMLKNINPTPGLGEVIFGTMEFVEFNGFVYFTGNDGANSGQNDELWRTDGTTAGTALFKDFYAFGGGGPGNFVNAGSYLFFTADNSNNGSEPWRTDGTLAGTVMIKDVFNLANVGSILGDVPTIYMNGYVYFVPVDVYDPANFNLIPPQSGYINAELWRTDGTSAGTTKVKEINPGMSGLTADANPNNFLVVGNTLYFTATDGSNGVELWKSDGTSAGTVLVKDINSGATGSSPSNLISFNGFIYFSANNGSTVNGSELWRTDGTNAGTVMVKDIRVGTGSASPSSFAALNSTHLMFSANDGVIGSELYMLGGPVVTVTTSANGKVDPPGVYSTSLTFDVAFVSGSNASFSFTPDAGNAVQSVVADGSNVGAGTTYSFSNITSNHTLNVTFGVGSSCTPPSITTAASSNTPICSGATLNLSVGATGTGPLSYSWSGTGSFTNGNTATPTVTGAASGNYIVTVSNSCGSTTSTATVTVNTLSTAPTSITGISTICNGSGTTLTQSGGALGTGANYKWYTASCGGTLAGTGPSITVSPSSNTTYFVRAEGTCNTTTCASVTVTVNSLSVAPSSITGITTICNGSGTTLTQSGGILGTGASYHWYTASCGGTPVGSGSSITVSPSSNTTYFVRAEGTCNTTACASVAVTVNSLSTAPSSITGNTTICDGSGTTLTQSGGILGTGASYHWYTASCGGTPVGSGSSITVSPSSNTTYFVRAEGTCNTTSCASVTVTVNTLSTAPTSITGITTICNGNGTTLTQSGGTLGTGANYAWYTASCGGTPVGTGPSITVSPSSNTTYFVRAEGTCNTTSCASVTVTVNTLSTAPTSITGITTICNGNGTTLTQSGGTLGTGANYYWYTNSAGAGPSAGTGPSITVNPSNSTTYYVRAEGVCNNTSDASVAVTVNPTFNTTSTVSIIGCYTWVVTNLTYSVTGTYTASFNSMAGCDSISTLNLTILPGVSLSLKAWLDGPFDPSLGLMHDSLRVNGLIPNTQPYTSSPYNNSAILELSDESVSSTVLSTTGNNAIVDWVMIELRSSASPSTVIANKRALIQRDGDIVSSIDGTSPVFFSLVNQGDYFVSLKHRNHLGVMSANAISLNGCSTTNIDFTTSAPVYIKSGITSLPRKVVGTVYTLWSADANNNKNVKYNGLNNDKDKILSAVGVGTPNGTVNAVYRTEDVNLDGRIRYNNTDNDRIVVLNNIGVSNPNNILNQHTPN